MAISFIHWAMRYFNNSYFAFAGKTVRSAERNIIMPVLECNDITDFFTLNYSKSNSTLTITSKNKSLNLKNTFYLFGGKDESSFALIQGVTLCGVLFDEVALMPKNFVEQAVARTLSVKKAKLWFNCNPEGPEHWFYKEWIKDSEENNIKNSLHLHFSMEDNPSLSKEQITKAKSLYSGIFYDRYILGKWVKAEGLIYPDISNLIKSVTKIPKFEKLVLGMDFGGNRSLTTFVITAINKDFDGITVLKDHFIKGKKGDIDAKKICEELVLFLNEFYAEFKEFPNEIRADCAEQYLINTLNKFLNKKGFNIPVKESIKGKINDRIRCTNTLISLKKLTINQNCKTLINGIKNAVWDKDFAEKGIDKRLDDFSTDIDILDAFEYSFSAFLKQLTLNNTPLTKKDRFGIISPFDFKGGWD